MTDEEIISTLRAEPTKLHLRAADCIAVYQRKYQQKVDDLRVAEKRVRILERAVKKAAKRMRRAVVRSDDLDEKAYDARLEEEEIFNTPTNGGQGFVHVKT
jgi:hypothetical protein